MRISPKTTTTKSKSKSRTKTTTITNHLSFTYSNVQLLHLSKQPKPITTKQYNQADWPVLEVSLINDALVASVSTLSAQQKAD